MKLIGDKSDKRLDVLNESPKVILKNTKRMYHIEINLKDGGYTTRKPYGNDEADNYVVRFDVFNEKTRRIKKVHYYILEDNELSFGKTGICKDEAIKKYKEEFKEYVKSFNLEGREENLVVYDGDEVIHSSKIEEGTVTYDPTGASVSYEDMLEGMYKSGLNKTIIATDSDDLHVGKFYGDYGFTMDNY